MDRFVMLLIFGLWAVTALIYKGKYRKMAILELFPIMLFIMLAIGMSNEKLTWLDNGAYYFLSKHASGSMTSFMRFITNFGSGYFITSLSILLIVVDLIRDHRVDKNNITNDDSKRKGFNKTRWPSVIVGLNALLIWLTNELLKLIFHRARPEFLKLTYANNFSFPSGHSMISIAFYGLLLYIYNKKNLYDGWQKVMVSALISFIILFIGISRIYLGVHYASDVIAGFVGGFAWLAAYIKFMNL